VSKHLYESVSGVCPRGGSSITVTDNCVILFGGANREQEHYNDVHALVRADGDSSVSWKRLETTGDIPPPRSGHSTCRFGDFVFLFGGIDFENEAVYNDLYTLNTVSLEWHYVGEAGAEISARNSHCLRIISTSSSEGTNDNDVQHFLVLYGGASPELGPLGDTYYAVLPKEGISDSTDFFVTWKLLTPSVSTPCPPCREMFSASVVPLNASSSRTGLLIAGGRNAETVLADTWILEPHNGDDIGCDECPLNWRKLSSMALPHPRCAHSASVVSAPPVLVLYGGFTGQGISEDVIISPLDFDDDSTQHMWKLVQPSSTIGGRFAHCMCPAPQWLLGSAAGSGIECTNGVLIFGGIDATQDYNDMWLLGNIRIVT